MAHGTCEGCQRPLTGNTGFRLQATVASTIRCRTCALTYPPLLGRSLRIAALVGTVLLPLAHGWWLGASQRRVRIAIPIVYAAFYLSQFLDLPDAAQKWINAVSIWQAAYLFCFFGPEVRAGKGSG